jgi:ABC-type multidrug transport system fused ATPase/permease subunit
MQSARVGSSTVELIGRAYACLSTRRRWQLATLTILMIITSFLEAVSIGSLLPFLVALTSSERINAIVGKLHTIIHINIEESQLRLFFTCVFVSAMIMAGLMRTLYFWLQTRLSVGISIDFSAQVYERTLHQPYEEIVRRNSSEVLAGAHKARDLVGYLIQPTLTLMNSIILLCSVLTALIIVDPILALSMTAGFATLYLGAMTITKQLLRINSVTYARELGRVNKVIQEGLGGIRDVIIDGTQATFSGLYKNALSKMQISTANNMLATQIPRYIIETLGVVILASLTFLLVSINDSLIEIIPVLGVAALGAQRLLPVLQQAYAAYTTILGTFHSACDALDLLEQPVPLLKVLDRSNQLAFKYSLSVDGLYFRYCPESSYVLNNVNLNIKPGEKIGFIGITGSGKSTFVDLLMGLLSPTKGKIFIDGCKLSQENRHQWYNCLSHVPQAIFLADSTIAENIAFGASEHHIDMSRVREAAKAAQISLEIEQLPNKYATRVGERGVRLSGGQIQRLGIARAIYKRSKVLIFDEATSALDTVTEANVMDAIQGLDRDVTILMVAHRINTLKYCDSIVELTNSTISWRGTYEELIDRLANSSSNKTIEVVDYELGKKHT